MGPKPHFLKKEMYSELHMVATNEKNKIVFIIYVFCVEIGITIILNTTD